MRSLLFVVSLLAGTALASAGECFRYEEPVTLAGTYRLAILPGPDKPESVALFDLGQPLCTLADDTFDGAENVSTVQLAGCPAGSNGSHASLTGALFAAHTGHHHTDVLLGCP